MKRYFIFIRNKENMKCDSITYWKPIHLGGCFVGKLDDEDEAVKQALRQFNKCYELEQSSFKEPVTWHIVDMEEHSVIWVGNRSKYRDLRKKQAEQKIPKNIIETIFKYEGSDIKVEYIGEEF